MSRYDFQPKVHLARPNQGRSRVAARRSAEQPQPPGFSLIELLVVVSIIALLMGLLLPALARSRDAGRVASCLANQKQLLTATHAYAADHRARLPTGPALPAVPFTPTTTWDEFFVNWVWHADGYYIGHGPLLERGYFESDTLILWCPGADQPEVYEQDHANLGVVGVDSFSGYAFRSYDQTTRRTIDDLGENLAGLPARMLFSDVNRHGPVGVLPSPATNHREEVCVVGYVDGHATAHRNVGQVFTARPIDYAAFPTSTLARFEQLVINMDFAERGDPLDAPSP